MANSKRTTKANTKGKGKSKSKSKSKSKGKGASKTKSKRSPKTKPTATTRSRATPTRNVKRQPKTKPTTGVIASALRTAIAQAAAGFHDAVVTLEVANAPTMWVQVSWEFINLPYPHAAEPTTTSQQAALKLPADVTISDWKRKTYLTLSHGANKLDALDTFVARYFATVLDAQHALAKLTVATA